MAGSVNLVILIGKLGADPEIRHTQDGRAIANLRIATSETWKDKDGNRQERTTWHRVVIFSDGLAKIAQQYLRKGSKVYVEGQLQTRKWQDQSGQDRYSTEVVLQGYGAKLVLLDGKPSGQSDDSRFEHPVDAFERQAAGQTRGTASQSAPPSAQRRHPSYDPDDPRTHVQTPSPAKDAWDEEIPF